jgi:hypothetical protein
VKHFTPRKTDIVSMLGTIADETLTCILPTSIYVTGRSDYDFKINELTIIIGVGVCVHPAGSPNRDCLALQALSRSVPLYCFENKDFKLTDSNGQLSCSQWSSDVRHEMSSPARTLRS